MSTWCHRCGLEYRACEKCTNEMIAKRDEEIKRLRARPVDWSVMAARQVWESIATAPRVAGPWEPGELGNLDVRRSVDGRIVATTLWVTPKYPVAQWRVPVATSDRDGADAVLREHGWLLA